MLSPKITGLMFTPENHRRIREGAKTQTRRILRVDPALAVRFARWRSGDVFVDDIGAHFCPEGRLVEEGGMVAHHDYGWIGDYLYVKEGIRYVPERDRYVYVLDGEDCGDETRHFLSGGECSDHYSAMFMPKVAARTFLKLTSIRCQQLQEISDEDAKAEGIIGPGPGVHLESGELGFSTGSIGTFRTAREAFACLWDSIHGRDSVHGRAPWEKNPWVWAITFKKAERPPKATAA